MAKLTAAFGTSHTPMLNSPAVDIPKHAAFDKAGRSLVDKDGRLHSYDELERTGTQAVVAELAPDVLEQKVARCQAGIARLADALRDAALDTLIVVGDDQHEQFFEDNMPAISIFWGEQIANAELPLPPTAPDFWRRARAQYHEPSGTRDYPAAADLAQHVIGSLIAQDFDVSVSKRLPAARGEGHAFGFVHRRLMPEAPIPIVLIALNTYYPPNQLTPRRCYRLGQAIGKAVEAWDRSARIGMLASGGLSHFVVDEAFDRRVLEACRAHDDDALQSLPEHKLQSGSSEIRNWIVAAGVAESLRVDWCDYIPCYRSAAGTGTGVAFMVWSE